MSEFKPFEEKANFAQLEHVQSKYVGTGNSETTREEWMLTQHRDTYASLIGHPSQLAYIGTAESQSIARVHFRLLESMIKPTVQLPSK